MLGRERERILCLMSSDVMRHIRDKLYVLGRYCRAP